MADYCIDMGKALEGERTRTICFVKADGSEKCTDLSIRIGVSINEATSWHGDLTSHLF